MPIVLLRPYRIRPIGHFSSLWSQRPYRKSLKARSAVEVQTTRVTRRRHSEVDPK